MEMRRKLLNNRNDVIKQMAKGVLIRKRVSLRAKLQVYGFVVETIDFLWDSRTMIFTISTMLYPARICLASWKLLRQESDCFNFKNSKFDGLSK